MAVVGQITQCAPRKPVSPTGADPRQVAPGDDGSTDRTCRTGGVAGILRAAGLGLERWLGQGRAVQDTPAGPPQ